MGRLENIVMDLIMEAPYYESKVFVPIIHTKEVYYPPSNIDEYYEQLWSELHQENKHPELDDILQDIALHLLQCGKIFDTYEDAKLYFYRSLLNKSAKIERNNKNRERLALSNYADTESYEDICDFCGSLKRIDFVYRKKNPNVTKANSQKYRYRGQYCDDCLPYVIAEIARARAA